MDNYEYELPSDFEDEEVDEDAAFNSEDERRYGHLFNKGGNGGGGFTSSEDEESDEEGEEGGGGLLDSDEESDGDDVSEDEDEDDSELEDVFAQAGKRKRGLGADDVGEEESDEDDLEDAEDFEDDDEQDQDAAHDAMVRAVTGNEGAAANKDRRKKREVVVTEAYPESEFNLPAAG